MEYLADTVTIIRHFSGAGRIGRQAKSILEGVKKGEHHMFLSTVSLVEILYLSEKKRITIKSNKRQRYGCARPSSISFLPPCPSLRFHRG